MSVSTPAARVRQRRNAAVPLPFWAPSSNRAAVVRDLAINVNGQMILLGDALADDPQISAPFDGTETVTIDVRDPDGDLQALLANEADLLDTGVSVIVNNATYMLNEVDVDEDTGTLVTLTFEDLVSWQMKKFSKYVAYSRSRYTRAQAVLKLVDQAGQPPLLPIAYFIPELTDKQRIAKGAKDTSSVKPGTGADTQGYTVKNIQATAAQRAVIDGILGECNAESAAKRVMVAAIMAATQESDMTTTAPGAVSGGKYLGPYSQNSSWGTAAERLNPADATKAFLRGWVALYGSVKTAPANLAIAIEGVQVSGLSASATYGQWETEATATVKTWTADGEPGGKVVDTSYLFTRGQNQQRETSWACTARWAQEVNFRRWAQRNVFYYVSDDELRAAAPALEVNGDEDWLVAPPGYTWLPNWAVHQVTLQVLAARWSTQVGASVLFRPGPVTGRFLVSQIDSYMTNPLATITLRRPASAFPEPASDTTKTTNSGENVDALLAECENISAQNRAYLYGGGHGVPLGKITPSAPLDCSSSCSLALWKVGMFKGDVAIVSGDFATSWGKPGKGTDFTVYANSDHVWIEFESPSSPYKRFDTSPHGSGGYGPHVRTGGRTDQSRFIARHWS